MRKTIHQVRWGARPLKCVACGETMPLPQELIEIRRRGGIPAVCSSQSSWETIYRDHGEYRRCIDPVTDADRITRRLPTPTEPGWYWAEWRIPEDGTDGEDEFVIGGPEIVEVWIHDFSDEGVDILRASVAGVRESQGLDCFVWLSEKLEVPKP